MHCLKKITPLLLGVPVVVNAQDASKPNIVFILADDMGWKDLACYGNKFTMTPHIDSLAKSGILFTDAYAACPVSSPTRASIMTGKYPARLHLTNYIAGNKKDDDSPVLPAKWKPFLEARETTIAELLHGAGYSTGMVGKWHLGSQDSIAPWSQGFGFTRMINRGGHDYYNYSICEDSYAKEFFYNGSEYLTDKLTDYCEEFIMKNKNGPFFLYLAYSAPHIAIIPRPDKLMKYFSMYNKSDEKFNPYYSALVESIDDGVGRIMETLSKLGLRENTIVIFTSDNGGLTMDEMGPTPTSVLPLRGGKGHVYEGGIRVPAIVSWPSKIKPGTVTSDYFTSVDYLPTLGEIAGIPMNIRDIDGVSILPLLKGELPSAPERPVFWHYPHFSNQMGRPAGAVRSGAYKLIRSYETGKIELYDLKADISESKDISGTMNLKAEELIKLFLDWQKNVDANMCEANLDYIKQNTHFDPIDENK